MTSFSVKDYFDTRALSFDASHKRCGWQSSDSQIRRFWAMSKNLDLSQSLIVDAGCGDGLLFNFLCTHFENIRYIGIDLSEKMIGKAREANPDGIYIVSDFDIHDFDSDYILSSGAYNLNTGTPIGATYESIANLYKKADVAISICLLSDQSPNQTTMFQYFNPQKSYEFGTSLTPYITLDHSYAKNDFCMTLFKR